jgi:hypothetical protein
MKRLILLCSPIVKNCISLPIIFIPFTTYKTDPITTAGITNAMMDTALQSPQIVISVVSCEKNNVDTFDSLVKNSLEADNEQILKIILDKMTKDPHNLIAVPHDIQTAEFCNFAMNISNGHYFPFVNPKLQTVEMALSAVKFHSKNLKHVRIDLIDENIINHVLKHQKYID